MAGLMMGCAPRIIYVESAEATAARTAARAETRETLAPDPQWQEQMARLRALRGKQ